MKKQTINFENWQQIKTVGIKDFSIHFHRRNLEKFLLDNDDLLINKIEPKRVIQISYENYFLSPENQKDYTKQIFQFLNLDYGNFHISFDHHQKILSNSLPEILLNYEQIYNCLKNTKYQCYL